MILGFIFRRRTNFAGRIMRRTSEEPDDFIRREKSILILEMSENRSSRELRKKHLSIKEFTTLHQYGRDSSLHKRQMDLVTSDQRCIRLRILASNLGYRKGISACEKNVTRKY